ncbi:inositol monophosphatase [Aeribacillus composti]|uniref:inositol monophosphatase family protein n=1 Tax=Aeribacillus composti TaxID=1868734 RepID=UPI002E206FBA|nr:inositol monophosphatase [Aeribacillus composti]
MYKQYLPFAIELAKDAGELIRPYAGKAGQQTLKSAKDFVTEMDLKAEKLIIDRIQETYPDHRIFSEEAGSIGGKDEFEWVIDPIDGTINYSFGVPLYGVSIALTYQNDPVVSAISLPAFGETYWAAKGEGAYLNGNAINIRNASLAEAFISIGDFAKDANKQTNKERISLLENIVNDVYRVRMIGTAAVTLAYIACGKLDIAVYYKPNFYDIAAGQLLVCEAGGAIQTIGNYTVIADQNIIDEIAPLLPVQHTTA